MHEYCTSTIRIDELHPAACRAARVITRLYALGTFTVRLTGARARLVTQYTTLTHHRRIAAICVIATFQLRDEHSVCRRKVAFKF